MLGRGDLMRHVSCMSVWPRSEARSDPRRAVWHVAQPLPTVICFCMQPLHQIGLQSPPDSLGLGCRTPATLPAVRTALLSHGRNHHAESALTYISRPSFRLASMDVNNSSSLHRDPPILTISLYTSMRHEVLDIALSSEPSRFKAATS